MTGIGLSETLVPVCLFSSFSTLSCFQFVGHHLDMKIFIFPFLAQFFIVFNTLVFVSIIYVNAIQLLFYISSVAGKVKLYTAEHL